jgi:hypothetical protein
MGWRKCRTIADRDAELDQFRDCYEADTADFIVIYPKIPASPSLLQGLWKLIILRPSDFRIYTKVAYLLIGGRPPAVTVYRRHDGIEIVECYVPAFTLSGHANTETTSRPLTIRILH